MALYFVDYDLRKQRNYQELYEALEGLRAKRVLESTWCLNRNNTSAKSLREYLEQFIESDDGVSVSEVTNWSMRNVINSPNDL